MHALTRSASLTDYEVVARSVGLDPFRMLRMAKLPAKVLEDPNLMIDASSVGWLLEESARLSGQEAFGLLLAERRSLANFGMLALVIRDDDSEDVIRERLDAYDRQTRPVLEFFRKSGHRVVRVDASAEPPEQVFERICQVMESA